MRPDPISRSTVPVVIARHSLPATLRHAIRFTRYYDIAGHNLSS
jgi:hypothetical protein